MDSKVKYLTIEGIVSTAYVDENTGIGVDRYTDEAVELEWPMPKQINPSTRREPIDFRLEAQKRYPSDGLLATPMDLRRAFEDGVEFRALTEGQMT